MSDRITLDGQEYRLAELNLNQLEELAPEFERCAMGAANVEEAIAVSRAHKTIVLASLKKHHPDLTIERIGELLNMKNRDAVFLQVMEVAGLKRSGEQTTANPSEP